MTRRGTLLGALALGLGLLAACGAREDTPETLTLTVEDDEKWWVGIISESHRMPLDASSPPFEIDLFGNTAGNQVQPLLLSTEGRYVWSEEPFRLAFHDGTIHLSSDLGPLQSGRQGSTLREASLHAARSFFPPSGKIPDETLFTHGPGPREGRQQPPGRLPTRTVAGRRRHARHGPDDRRGRRPTRTIALVSEGRSAGRQRRYRVVR